jgi:hypothetical protein
VRYCPGGRSGCDERRRPPKPGEMMPIAQQ